MRENCTTSLFNEDWTFLKTKPDTTYEEMKARLQEFAAVELPHDFLIYNAKDLYEDCFGWYRKEFELEQRQSGHIFIDFGAVYMDCSVYVNDRHVGDWKYGYSCFEMELTQFVSGGSNEIVVLVRHLNPNSRWYSGAGIYRDVYLRMTEESYLPTDGTYLHTTKTETGFLIEVETELVAQNECLMEYDLFEKESGRTILSQSFVAEAGISPVSTTLLVEHPNVWSIEKPACYTLLVSLIQDGITIDEQEITTGFRTMEFKPESGFYLNGEHIKLNGVCEHHDLGCLGSAMNKAALRRQFDILKTMGVNALRTSHNMPDEAFMDLADEMGFVVMDEAFDMWEREKTQYDYARFFKEWADKDIRTFVRRDRNHPSLLLWSIGNEIYDTHADSHGQEITRRLVSFVRESDPKGNAPITIASNYMAWEGAQACADIVKFAGYNYGERLYEEQHREHPDWIIYGSETASVVQSRGIYHFPYEQSILADEDEQCSALGNSATSWGAKSTTHCIVDDRDAKFSFGQFIWTGFDYIGEPTPYHTKNSYFGQIDTAGYPKDPYYLFQAEWTDVKKKPMVHLYPYWDFNEGQLVDVCAVTNASMVELFVNGVSQGIREIDHANGKELVVTWKVPYTPGTIEAVAYENGKVVAKKKRTSFGDSKKIRLTPYKKELLANGKDLQFITIETLDEAGNVVENATDYVTVSVEGPGRLLGLDNGDSTDYDDYKTDTRRLFSGKLLAIIGTTNEPGDITVNVTGAGLLKGSIRLTAKDCEKKTPGYFEDVQKLACRERGTDVIPVRKLEIVTEGEKCLTAEHPEMEVCVQVHPATYNDAELLWKAVSVSGIPVNFVSIEPMDEKGQKVMLRAKGDGAFYLRCSAKDKNGKITAISQTEFAVEGVGTCYLEPYELVTGGLYTASEGNIGNGNEKGIATSNQGLSWVAFENTDFTSQGSDTISIPVFALSGEEYPIEIWRGKPYTENAVLVDTVIYQKEMIWNEYQAMTYKLPRRFQGICTVGLAMRDRKVHIKGFSFEKQEKAFSTLYAENADRIYGDTFTRNGKALEGIGNNVTLEYEDMDFGTNESLRVTITGATPLPVNTVHFRFNPYDGGESMNGMAEFVHEEGCTSQTFEMPGFCGRGRLDIVFLPGSSFDLESFCFHK